MTIHNKFNNILKEFFKNTPISKVNKNIPWFLIGSDDNTAQKEFYLRPEILNIYSSSIDEVFTNNPDNSDIFHNQNLKIGFSQFAVISLTNLITSQNDSELQDYWVNNKLSKLNKVSLLWGGDRLTDTSLDLILKINEPPQKNNSLEERFINFLLKRIDRSKIDLTDSFSVFLNSYSKDLENIEKKSTIFQFIQQKYPKKSQIFENSLNMSTEKNIISVSTNLISVKINKEQLYTTISDETIISTDRFFYSLAKIEDFFNKEKEKLGLNYCVFFGHMNHEKNFNLIVETNHDFKLSISNFSESIPQLFNLFFEGKNKDLSDIEITNAHSIMSYYSLKSTTVENVHNKSKLKL